MSRCDLDPYVCVIGIIFISGLGSLMHFTYAWSGCNAFVGFFSATNESVWEHTKLMYWPQVLFSLITFYFLRRDYVMLLSKDGGPVDFYYILELAVVQAAAGQVSSIWLMWVGFYVLYVGFGIESAVLNILLFVFTIAVGQFFGLVCAESWYPDQNRCWAFMSALVLVFHLSSMSIFTYLPPHLEFLFQDFPSGKYGPICTV